MPINPPGTFVATFTTEDGGDFKIQLAPDCDLNDLRALGPVVDAIREFVEEPWRPLPKKAAASTS